MCPRQDSNLDLGFRKPSFYPLNYGDSWRCLYGVYSTIVTSGIVRFVPTPPKNSPRSFKHPIISNKDTVLTRPDGTPFWQFLQESKIAYQKTDFPFLSNQEKTRVRQVFDFEEYLSLQSQGEALAYLYAGLGRALNYVGPVLDLEREHGFNDHTDRHTLWVAKNCIELLQRSGHSYLESKQYGPQTEVLAVLVGMMHDLGNLLSRKEHSLYSVWLLNTLFAHTKKTKQTKEAWKRVCHAVLFHEEPVLKQEGVTLATGDPLQWALVAADKMHVGRDRIGPRAFQTGIKKGALEQDVHIFVNAMIVRSTWYLGQQAFVWHLDFSVDQLEEKFAAFTKGEPSRIWVPGFVQKLFMKSGQRYRDTFAKLFLEIYSDRLAMAAESVFLLFPFASEFRVRLVDNDTRGKVGTGEMIVWQQKRKASA